MPAIRASRPRLTETLKDGGRGATAGRPRQRLRHGARRRRDRARTSVAGGVRHDHARLLPLPLRLAGIRAGRPVDDARGAAGGEVSRAGVATAVRVRPVGTPRCAAWRQSVAIANVLPSTGNNSGRAIELEGVPNPGSGQPADGRQPPGDRVVSLNARASRSCEDGISRLPTRPTRCRSRSSADRPPRSTSPARIRSAAGSSSGRVHC